MTGTALVWQIFWVAIPAFLLAWFFQPLLPVGLGFAGGAMIFLVVTGLIPESLALHTSKQRVGFHGRVGNHAVADFGDGSIGRVARTQWL